MYIAKKPIEVLYADTDMMGVVYHANYLKYFESGRSQLLEDLGLHYLDLEARNLVVPVFDVQLSYKHAIRYGDRIFVKVWIELNGGVKTVYGYEIVNEEETIVYATGTTTHALVQRDTFKPVVFKRVAPDWFQVYEDAKKKVD